MNITWNQENVCQLNEELSQLDAAGRILWTIQRFKERLTFACSFGAEDVVVLDLLLKAKPDASVFVLDTGRLHQETYDLMDAAGTKYGRGFTVFAPQAQALQELVSGKGPNSFYASIESRKECCRIRKVEPLARALADVDAWLTGLRREQAVTRSSLEFAEVDAGHGNILKLNLIADWPEERVWNYIREKSLPYNALHDKGFPSIGCAPCTRAIAPREDVRAGRWWWESPEHKECGLHLGSGI